MRYYDIGIDIGGTFTDLVCRRPGEAALSTKIMSTRKDPSAAVLRAITYMIENWGVKPEEIGHFLHGTTVATNAVLERNGAKLGLLTTEGFRDVLEIGRQLRHQLYGIILAPHTPVFLAPGKQRKEIGGRMDANGVEIAPLDEAAVRAAVEALVADGVEAIAVCYLFSFLNPTHELRTREIIHQIAPHMPVSLACEVDPVFREYERTVVTAFDGYMKPIIARYMTQIEEGLGRAGVAAPLQVMQARGGLAISTVARQRPVRLFMSGPAAGVIGGVSVGRTAGVGDLITVDIGGTSCDIALIQDGRPVIRPEGIIDGFTVRVPMVDVNAIGSGGGSLAWIDCAGGLRVGPQSAGSDPGPAAYGKGGDKPTVTDASLLLGYLNPEYFAAGSVELDVERSRAAIAEVVAGPLGLGIEEAALGIHRVVNAQMVEGIRLVSVRQGIDPRRFALVPLGGAGPLHATALAGELGVSKVIVPRRPGVLSASGLLSAPIEHEVSAGFPTPLKALDFDKLRAALAELDAQCAELMSHERLDGAPTQVSYFADMWYQGQSYFLEVPLSLDEPDLRAALAKGFRKAHDRVYGYAFDAPMGVVNVRSVHASFREESFDEDAYAPEAGDPLKGERLVRIDGIEGPVPARVYERDRMPVGMTFEGPAIVEQADTTTLVGLDWRGEMDSAGLLVLTTIAAAPAASEASADAVPA